MSTRKLLDYTKVQLQKDEIITMIENDCNNGQAFDDEYVEALMLNTVTNLYTLQKLFLWVYKKGREEE